LTYQFPEFVTETLNTKHVLEIKLMSYKNLYSAETKQKSKCERRNVSRGNKPWTKTNPKSQEKYPCQQMF